MASTLNISRSQIILAICLPLSVLIGYFLAEGELVSMGIVLLVCGVLAVPVLMQWHHPLLVFSWNLMFNPFFLPGRPELWTIMTGISLGFTVLSRAINHDTPRNYVPSVSWSLGMLAVLVIVTAHFTGGMGLRMLGSNEYGGKKYFYLLMAIAGYFALATTKIPVERAGFYIALFLLPGVTAAAIDLGFLISPKLIFLANFFPDETMGGGLEASVVGSPIVRYTGLAFGTTAIYGYLLARYGVRGIMNLRRPWRLAMLAFSVYLCMLGGFRSSLILFVLVFGAVFWFEGLWRTRYLAILLGFAVLGGAVLLPNVQKLPLSIQRALTFLPLNVDPMVRSDASGSTEWRLEMWKAVLPQVPSYLLTGKGYNIDGSDLYLTQLSAGLGFEVASAGAIVAGDYHNGPLSVIVPFGLPGLAVFAWFLTTSGLLLLRYQRHGDPRLYRVNTLLLGLFVAKVILFFAIFGSLYSDMWGFTGIVGMGVALNGSVPVPDPEKVAKTSHS